MTRAPDREVLVNARTHPWAEYDIPTPFEHFGLSTPYKVTARKSSLTINGQNPRGTLSVIELDYDQVPALVEALEAARHYHSRHTVNGV